MTDETIGHAIRVFGRALAAGQTQEAAMRAAFNSVFGLGGPNTKRVTINGVDLVVSYDGEPEDGWTIMVQHGTDIAPLLSDDQVAVIDRVLPKAQDVLIDSMGFSGSIGVR
jgi:hypothetical protein